ncbi:MAG: hypothetical protein MJ208_02795 [Bacilli bacterium]|nr:hypothetical protein [Bacilli bacterium]
MNISSLYDKSIKLIDDSYSRLQRIWVLPKGSISKKMINNHPYYYHQYRDGKKVVSRIIKDEELVDLKKRVNERKKLVKLNKNAKNELNKNIRVIAIFDKGLSASLLDEAFAYSFDEIPISQRKHVMIPLVNVVHNGNSSLLNNPNLKEYFEKWQNGEIRAREISNYIIQKISD